MPMVPIMFLSDKDEKLVFMGEFECGKRFIFG